MSISLRTTCRATLLTLLLASLSLSAHAQTDYHNDPHFQKKWEEAKEIEKKHQRDLTAAAYRKANEAAKGQCEECLLASMKFDSLAKNYKQVLRTAAQAESMPDISKRGLAEAYVFEANALVPDVASASSEDLSKAHALYGKAMDADSTYIMSYWGDGQALAMMDRAKEASERFHYVATHARADGFREKAQRYEANPALAGMAVAPSFHLATLDGKVIHSDDLRGRVVLLVFYNTRGLNNVNGHHYQENIPYIQDVFLRHKDDPFTVITVYFGNKSDDATLFSQRNPAPWPQVADPAGKVSGSFHVTHIPTYILMGPDGDILAKEEHGHFDLRDQIDRAIVQAKNRKTNTALVK